MKKTAKICVAVLSLSALTSLSAYAAKPGAYVGLGLGYGKQKISVQRKSPLPTISKTDTLGGVAGRVFGGYNINQYFGVEASLVKFSNATNKLREGTSGNTNTYKMAALDLVGKAYLPVQNTGLNLYALGGAAIVHSSLDSKTTFGPTTTKASLTQTAIRPVAGAGVSYDIPNTQLTTSLEYSHTFGRGKVTLNDAKIAGSKAIPSTDLVTVNLAYNFG